MNYVDINMSIYGRISIANLAVLLPLVEATPGVSTQLGAADIEVEPVAEPEAEEPAKPTPRTRKPKVDDVAASPAPKPVAVDAGTGKPLVADPPTADGEDTVMTFDEVKAKATLLAATDSVKLAAILQEFGAGKLSEVPEDKLGEFAGQVLEALG